MMACRSSAFGHLFTLPGFAAPCQEFPPLLAVFLLSCMLAEALFRKLIFDTLRCWDKSRADFCVHFAILTQPLLLSVPSLSYLFQPEIPRDLQCY